MTKRIFSIVSSVLYLLCAAANIYAAVWQLRQHIYGCIVTLDSVIWGQGATFRSLAGILSASLVIVLSVAGVVTAVICLILKKSKPFFVLSALSFLGGGCWFILSRGAKLRFYNPLFYGVFRPFFDKYQYSFSVGDIDSELIRDIVFGYPLIALAVIALCTGMMYCKNSKKLLKNTSKYWFLCVSVITVLGVLTNIILILLFGAKSDTAHTISFLLMAVLMLAIYEMGIWAIMKNKQCFVKYVALLSFASIVVYFIFSRCFKVYLFFSFDPLSLVVREFVQTGAKGSAYITSDLVFGIHWLCPLLFSLAFFLVLREEKKKGEAV